MVSDEINEVIHKRRTSTELVLYINSIFVNEEEDKEFIKTLYNKLLVFSGLTKSRICRTDTCYGRFLATVYVIFIQLILLMGNLNILLFNFTLNPYDISVFIYFLFFLGFFIYARYFYNIEDHYNDLMALPIIKNNCENKQYIKCLIRTISFSLFSIIISYWAVDSYYYIDSQSLFNQRGNRIESYYKPHDIFSNNFYNYLYKPVQRLTSLYIYFHILCYIVNITFVFTIHKYQLKDFNEKLKNKYIDTPTIIDDFTDIRISVKNSVKRIGNLMNLGISCVLFKLPLEILDIIKEKNIVMIIPFIINSVCFFYGIYQASCINNYNNKFVRAFYQNKKLRESKENVDYLITFFENNKIYFKVMGTTPTTETLVKILLVVINIGFSLISGIISNKLL